MAFLARLQEFMAEDGDEFVMGWLWKALLAVVVCASLTKVPYGKCSHNEGLLPRLLLTSLKLPARPAWFMMESPAFFVPGFLLLGVGGRYVTGAVNPNMVLLGMFLLHYFNRSALFLHS